MSKIRKMKLTVTVIEFQEKAPKGTSQDQMPWIPLSLFEGYVLGRIMSTRHRRSVDIRIAKLRVMDTAPKTHAKPLHVMDTAPKTRAKPLR